MLLFTPVLAAGLGVYMLFDGKHGDAMIFFITAIATLLVTSAFIAPCRYTILDDALSIRCGIICYQVPLEEIDTIEASGTWRSGPALSMRRVLITTSKRYVVISPRERDEFMADLNEAIAGCKKS